MPVCAVGNFTCGCKAKTQLTHRFSQSITPDDAADVAEIFNVKQKSIYKCAVVMASRGVAEGRKTAIPFGPFMLAGALLALFFAGAASTWYGNLLTHSLHSA